MSKDKFLKQKQKDFEVKKLTSGSTPEREDAEIGLSIAHLNIEKIKKLEN